MKAEFHIGDRVVTQTGSGPKEFTIKAMCLDSQGRMIYTGDHVGWVLQEDLDYCFEGEDQKLMFKLEAEIQDFETVKENLKQDWLLFQHSSAQPSLKKKFHKMVGEAMGWSGWDG
jgi:hypothetical protein